MFRVGMKVVCVMTPIPQPECPYPIFTKGSVYTVAFFDFEKGDQFIGVYELSSCVSGHIAGFRPVVERKTDISVFQALLNDAPIQQELAS